MKITIYNSLYLDGVPTTLEKLLIDNLTYENPKYKEAVQFGRSTKGIAKNIKQFNKERTGSLIIPRGWLNSIIKYVIANKIPYVIEDKRSLRSPVRFVSKIRLRDYQSRAISTILESKQTEGMLISPPGSGKTVMALELISKLKQPTLWLTHRTHLMEQFINRAEEFLGVPRDEIGVIQGSRIEVGKKLTVGMVATIHKQRHRLHNKFGAVFVDECHHTPADTFTIVLNYVAPHYLFGITATPYRNDELEQLMFNAIGHVLYSIDLDTLILEGGIIKPQIVKVYTNIQPSDEKAKEAKNKYNDLLQQLIDNVDRNRMIVQLALHKYQEHKTIILSKRVAHCEYLYEWLTQVPELRVELALGKHGKRKRDEVSDAVNNGNFDILIATDQLLEEGFDYKPLSKLIFATPKKGMASVIQSIGRIMRTSEGKKGAIVYDLIDNHPIFQRQSAHREDRVYYSNNMPQTSLRI